MDFWNQDHRFVNGILEGDCSVVDEMLASGCIPDKSSICVACKIGDVDIVTRLLSCGAVMDVQQAFLNAVLHNHYYLLDHLFLAGGNVNMPYNHGDTLLHYVTCPKICKWLLDMGACQAKNNHGQTPLYFACQRFNLPIAKLLLQHNSRPTSNFSSSSSNSSSSNSSSSNSSSSNSSSSNSNSSDFGLELTCSEILEFDDDGDSCLNQACYRGDIEMVKLLLQYKEGVNIIEHTDKCGDTCLRRACIFRYSDIVKLLLQYKQGINIINIPGENQETPLITACRRNQIDTVEILLQHLCNPIPNEVSSKIPFESNEVSSKSNESNEVSFESNKVSFEFNEDVRHILNIVDAINAADKDGQTALHWTCKNSVYTTTRFITSALKDLEQRLSQSMSLNLVQAASLTKDKHGLTPIDLADGHPGILGLLKQ